MTLNHALKTLALGSADKSQTITDRKGRYADLITNLGFANTVGVIQTEFAHISEISQILKMSDQGFGQKLQTTSAIANLNGFIAVLGNSLMLKDGARSGGNFSYRHNRIALPKLRHFKFFSKNEFHKIKTGF